MLRKIASLFFKGLSTPLSSPDMFGYFNVSPTASGVPIDAYAILRCPAAQGGIRLISDAVASLDVRLYRGGDEGRELVEAKDHPVARLLRQPNPWTGETEFKRQLVQDFLVWGNGEALVTRVQGLPRELHRIDPRACSITIDLVTTEPTYTVAMQNGGSHVYAYGDVVHVKNLSVDNIRGLGLTTIGSDAIGVATVLERHAARLFGRGARPAGILEYAKRLSQDQIDALRVNFNMKFGGSEESAHTLVLEDGIKFQALQLASTDSQFVENRRFQTLEIARLLNLPPSLVGEVDQSTKLDTEEIGQQFLDRTITPILELIEDALERTLLTDEERDAGYEIEFDTTNFARANMEKRFAAYKSGIEAGVLLLNEARDREGLPPVDGGDTPMRSVQTLPLNAPAPLPPA